VGRVVSAACRGGRAALLAAALWSCGLAVSGEATQGVDDGSTASTSSSGSSGSSGYGSSGVSSSGSSSGSALTFDTGLPGYDSGSTSADASVQGGRDAGADSHPLADAGPRDASDDGATCAKLSSCCTLLTAYGSSSMSIASCLSAAASKNSSTCQTVLSPFESLLLCP
jgi:hypothetical protein